MTCFCVHCDRVFCNNVFLLNFDEEHQDWPHLAQLFVFELYFASELVQMSCHHICWQILCVCSTNFPDVMTCVIFIELLTIFSCKFSRMMDVVPNAPTSIMTRYFVFFDFCLQSASECGKVLPILKLDAQMCL